MGIKINEDYRRTLVESNVELKEWLIEDCVCAYMSNDIMDEQPDTEEELIKENKILTELLACQCSCKG